MDIGEVKFLVTQFREGAEKALAANQFKEQPFNEFPKACCGDTVWLVAQYLKEHDRQGAIQFRYVYGSYDDDDFENRCGHAWLEVIWTKARKKVIVDITSDQPQFRNTRIFPQCASVPYYVGRKNEFYSLFEVIPCQCSMIDGIDQLFGAEKVRMRKLYNTIVKFIDD